MSSRLSRLFPGKNGIFLCLFFSVVFIAGLLYGSVLFVAIRTEASKFLCQCRVILLLFLFPSFPVSISSPFSCLSLVFFLVRKAREPFEVVTKKRRSWEIVISTRGRAGKIAGRRGRKKGVRSGVFLQIRSLTNKSTRECEELGISRSESISRKDRESLALEIEAKSVREEGKRGKATSAASRETERQLPPTISPVLQHVYGVQLQLLDPWPIMLRVWNDYQKTEWRVWETE
jgi:hypothetical protein